MDINIIWSFSWYLALLSSFCFFSHPIANCMLLVLSVLSLSNGVYGVLGFSWYLAMFCVVYVGGVYILLIFVFLSYSNNGITGGFGCCLWIFGVFTASYIYLSSIVSFDLLLDESKHLTIYGFRSGYLFLCVVMLLSLVEASAICSYKNSFYR